jgi:hypothetical protein
MFLVFFFSLSHLHRADENFEDKFLPNRWTFFIGSPRLFIIFDFQQLLLLTNFDQTHRYGDRTVTSHQCSHFTTCSLSHRHRANGNFEDEFLPNRWTFINRKSAFVHNFWFPATFINDKFWSDSRLRRSHRGDVLGDTFSSIDWSSDTFGDTFDWAILLVTFFHRSIDQAILLVTLSIERYFWWHFFIDRLIERYFWWHFCVISGFQKSISEHLKNNRATCASGSGSVGVTPAHFPPPLQLLLFGDTFCHTFDREQQLR